MMQTRWNDRSIESVIGDLLRWGVALSGFVVLGGGCFYLLRRGGEPADYRVFHGEPSEFRSVLGVFHSAATLHPTGVIQFGLVLLMLTPVARVAFSVLGFAAERDRLYVVFTLIVLSVLLYSLMGSGVVG
jgi:uncharacterized membrane protein